MKKFASLITALIYAFVGGFLGYGIFVAWNYKTHPEVYTAQSAPWYTSILLYGAVTLVLLAVCMIAKTLIKRRIKAQQNRPTE